MVNGFLGDTVITVTRHDAGGTIDARLQLPHTARVTAAGSDHVVAIMENNDGEQSVTVYGVRPGAAR